jgi:aarF domain-containing kinase
VTLQVCCQNGGIYVKAAQFASNLLTIPEDYRVELGRLMNCCKPISMPEVRALIEAETGKPLEATYAWVSEQPVAAASLAQVHHARLHDGREVAVKVQYPGVAIAVAADLRVCSMLAGIYAWLGGKHVNMARNILHDLSKRLQHEVDFRNEIKNSRQLRLMSSVPSVTVPAILDHLSSKRLLTMEWIDGVCIDDVVGLRRAGLDAKAVGARFLAAFADMLYVQGNLHGDLHPGNVLVRASGDSFEIVLLDHGWYVKLPDALRKQYCRLWCAFVLQDSATAEAVAAEIAGPQCSAVVPAVLSLGGLQSSTGQGGRNALHLATKERAPSASEQVPFSPKGLESLSAIRYFPSEVVEILRSSQAARNIGQSLGCLAADRLAINAKAALFGLAVEADSTGKVSN